MAKRITQLLPPVSIYTNTTHPAESAWVNHEGSRFAATKQRKADPHWDMTVRRSGGVVTSAIGKRKNKNDVLRIIAAFEALNLDMAPFDNLPQITPETTKCASFRQEDVELARKLAERLLDVAKSL